MMAALQFESKDKLSNTLDTLWADLQNLLNDTNESKAEIAVEIGDIIFNITKILTDASNVNSFEITTCEFCKKNNPFYQIYNWTGKHRECLKILASKQLQYFYHLISNAAIPLLSCKEVYVPLFLLLLSLKPSDKRKAPPDIELLFSKTLYHVANRILDDKFLEILSKDLSVNENFIIPKFTFFQLLLNFTHHSSEAGQFARDGIILCLHVAKSHKLFEDYITHSSINVIIAGGLSAHYSSLPTSFQIFAEDWHMISKHDLTNMKELRDFLGALHFCCDVMKNSNRVLQTRLVELIHDGFLLSVLVPALNQSSLEAQTAVLAYLDLFLRSISFEPIMEVFLRVLMTEAYDGQLLIDLLIYHINAEDIQLSTVAIQLFTTLLELNCEDVLFNLVFRYLLPCNHILPNQKRTIKEMDFYCKNATMFLYLTPSCCIETNKSSIEFDESPTRQSGYSFVTDHQNNHSVNSRKTSLTNSTSSGKSQTSIPPELTTQQTLDFMAYLNDAKLTITAVKKACKCWSAVYDGMDVVTERCSTSSLRSRGFSSTSDGPTTFRSLSVASGISTDSKITTTVPDINFKVTSDCLGPFLNALLIKVESMMENNLYVNLLLTSLIRRLACYPQPLLRSFLINSNLVIKPGVRSLAQVLTRVSFAIDGFLFQLDDYQALLVKARQNLLQRRCQRLKRLSQEVCDINSNEEEETVTIALDPHAGAGRFRRKESLPERNGSVFMGVDELVSLTPTNSYNRSPIAEEKILHSNSFVPQSHGKLHPAIPKAYSKTTKGKRATPSKSELLDMRKKNPVLIKNAVYCAVILEEFMKELAAISIEQTLL